MLVLLCIEVSPWGRLHKNIKKTYSDAKFSTACKFSASVTTKFSNTKLVLVVTKFSTGEFGY